MLGAFDIVPFELATTAALIISTRLEINRGFKHTGYLLFVLFVRDP